MRETVVTFARVHRICEKPIFSRDYRSVIITEKHGETRDRTPNAIRTIMINYPGINPRRRKSLVLAQTRKNKRRSTAARTERGATRVISARSCGSAPIVLFSLSTSAAATRGNDDQLRIRALLPRTDPPTNHPRLPGKCTATIISEM